MARKRLNKKVALIGSLVFVVVGFVLILAILGLSRDPQKFITDADAALKAATEATDDQTKDDAFETAERNYGKARQLAKTDTLRIEILFKAANLYFQWGKWPNVMGCWSEIIKIDPENLKARYARLKSTSIIAESGVDGLWKEVESQASEFIDLIEEPENANLISQDTAQLECFGLEETPALSQRLGPFLYLLRGKAILDITRQGAVTNPAESLGGAIADLKKVQELEPDNANTYLYLALASLINGELLAKSGNLAEKEKAGEEAKEYLNEAVSRAGDDPQPQIRALRMKLMLAPDTGSLVTRQSVLKFEPEYLSLTEKFPSAPEAHMALGRFYGQLGAKYLDKAVEAGEEACKLDQENVGYAMDLANLYYKKFSCFGQESGFDKAVQLAASGLELLGAQGESGPREHANRRQRLSLYVFLGNCYIGRVLDPPGRGGITTESQRQEYLERAEQTVHEIEQVVGSGENMHVVKWQGMLELAKGDVDGGVRKMYAAYEQFRSLDPDRGTREDPMLSYRLAKVFENSGETGAVAEFLASALRLKSRMLFPRIDDTWPESLLDYAEALLTMREYSSVLNFVNFFESEYWPNRRSRTVRIAAHIGANQWDEAEKELADKAAWSPDDPNTVRLSLALLQAKIRQKRNELAQMETVDASGALPTPGQEDVESGDRAKLMTAELKGYEDDLARLLLKLLQIDPNSVAESTFSDVCNNLRAAGRFDQGTDIVDRFLQHFPDNVTALLYKKVFSAPEPDKISAQEFSQMREDVLSNIGDPIRRAANLGIHYYRNGETEKAVSELRQVLNRRLSVADKGEEVKEEAGEVTELERVALSFLFNAAVGLKDWELAEQTAEVARRENIDGYQGRFFEAHVASAKEQYEDALAKIDECLKLRPVYSDAFALRSNVNAALGNEQAAIEDAQKAASLNPLNGAIAKLLFSALYKRNNKLGDNVMPSQMLETESALVRAVAVNPTDVELLSFYAEYISKEKPLKALAIRQRLQKGSPSVRNAVFLGRLAAEVAMGTRDPGQKKMFLDVADSAFEEARKIDPNDKLVLRYYTRYLRARGLEKEAELVLQQAKDQELLWNHYLASGQFDSAKNVLEQLYNNDPEDSNVVKGLLLVSDRTGDREAIKKYSQQLVQLEDSLENGLIQIRTFLKTGLVKEAEHKLQSLAEKYPNEPELLLLEGWLAMRQGRLKDALALTNRSLETAEDRTSAWRLRGEINRLRANYEQAIADLRQSKALSNDPGTRYYLAKAYWQAGRLEDAITELEVTVDDPGAPVQSRELLERVYLQTGRRTALQRFYAATLAKLPDSVFWRNRAAAFAVAQGDISGAQQLYAEALQRADKDGGHTALAVDGYLRSLILAAGDPNGTAGVWDPQKLDAVVEEAKKYLDGDYASVAYLRMAEARLKLGDRAGAIEYCRKAVDEAGTNEDFATDILHKMYMLLGTQEVLEYCKERLENNPDSLAANLAMFNLMKMSGQYDEALNYINRCIQIIGPQSPRRVDYGLRKTAVLQASYSKTSDKKYLVSAIAEYESLLAKMPNSISVLNNLAYMLAENNERPAEALKYAKRACDEAPNNPNLLDTYAYVLYKNGEYSKADECLQAALQQFEFGRVSAPADVYEHLGMIKEGLNAATEAAAAYRRALEIGEGTMSEVVKQRIEVALRRVSQ